MLKNLYKTNFVKMNFANAACAKFLTPQRYPIEIFLSQRACPASFRLLQPTKNGFSTKTVQQQIFKQHAFAPSKANKIFIYKNCVFTFDCTLGIIITYQKQGASKMKLNYKRTLLVGFAFFLICAFWQAYETIIPLMLTNKFGLDQTWSGFIMSLDNILALFMLPLFGALSDKKDTRYGKRTPFIFIGTLCAVVCFVGLTFADNAQLDKISQGTKQTYWEQNYRVENREYHSVTNNGVAEFYTVHDYAAKVYFDESYDNLSSQQQQQLESWYDQLTYDSYYVYNHDSNTYKLCFPKTEGSGLFAKTTYYYADGTPLESGARTINAYSSLVSEAENQFAHSVTQSNAGVLVVFIVVLLLTLVAMAVFRSPAVALMPDVTVKPLRSKANAIINLMGTAGGILVLLLGMVFGTGKVSNQLMSYTWFVVTVCAIMVVALAVFILTVKEKRWNKEMLEQHAVLDQEESQTEPQAETAPQQQDETEKLPKDKLRSLIFILASVALWFIGYNAITSKYSVYAVNVLNKDYNTTLLIAQAAAVVAYIPVGLLASKIGRKKSILIGVALLALAFFGAIFITSASPSWLISVLFALAGIAWATINVNSFPMVVELSKGGNIGKYTGYYYTASMAAQVVTPILSGALMDALGTMSVLFPYATVFVVLSFVTMIFVKHGDSKPTSPKDKMEMLAGADD